MQESMTDTITRHLESVMADFNKSPHRNNDIKYAVLMACVAIEALLNIAEAIREIKK